MSRSRAILQSGSQYGSSNSSAYALPECRCRPSWARRSGSLSHGDLHSVAACYQTYLVIKRSGGGRHLTVKIRAVSSEILAAISARRHSSFVVPYSRASQSKRNVSSSKLASRYSDIGNPQPSSLCLCSESVDSSLLFSCRKVTVIGMRGVPHLRQFAQISCPASAVRIDTTACLTHQSCLPEKRDFGSDYIR